MWRSACAVYAAVKSTVGLSHTVCRTPARGLSLRPLAVALAQPEVRPRRGLTTHALSSPATSGVGLSVAEPLHELGLELELVQCLSDNYCPILHHSASGTTILMDTPQAGPIAHALRRKNWQPTHILNTHHHNDHVGGNTKLKKEFPDVQIIGPHRREHSYPPGVPSQADVVPLADRLVGDGEEVKCGPFSARVMLVPGHTASHIAYFFPSEVPFALVGDCLFTLGCGRVFTGDFGWMQSSMEKLRGLPDETIVFCAHEYTASNLDFALQVEPENDALQARAEAIRALRAEPKQAPTVPTLLQHEKATNPFLRWDASAVQQSVHLPGGSSKAVFEAVRRWKDTGRRPQP